MTADLNPGLVLIAGAVLVPLLPVVLRAAWMLLLPAAALALVVSAEPGAHGVLPFLSYDLVTFRLDALGRVFALVFLLATAMSVIYTLHARDPLQQVAGLVYAGAGVGGVLAGDLVTLFVFWELTALASVFLVWARGGDAAYRAGMRYLIVQVGSGVLLMAGVIVHVAGGGSLAFEHIGLDAPGGLAIFLAFGIKAAFPLLHAWLVDAYPKATIAGTVWLSIFTTKLAVYALARGFAGTEILIWIGVAMAVFTVFYAIVENDLRKVLAYNLITQLGFMVTGIGIGTELSLNGTVAHATASVLYQALLFMTIGALMLRTGSARITDLGGLYKSMPWTAAFCIVGAASISALPLTSGFVSKSMVLSALGHEHLFVPWLLLTGVSAAALQFCGLRVPYFAFFGEDRGHRVAEAPASMLAPMAITAFLCIGIGIAPGLLYALLPFPVDYAPYTVAHVVNQMQLVAFSALVFIWLLRGGGYPAALPAENLDVDVLYRKALPAAVGWTMRVFGPLDRGLRAAATGFTRHAIAQLYRHHGPSGTLTRTMGAGNMAFWIVLVLAVYLIIALGAGVEPDTAASAAH
ncbi:MAG: Na(+)/H(+) antiporter subunit D [Geminicoccaceae bacterium]|nr:Na(+)/H(+) antiporter subunit D [Geminicoccaceae bacterium]